MTSHTPPLTWLTDVLGSPWQHAYFSLPDDGHGPSRGTLIRHGKPTKSRAVVYIHGFVDYFFQTHMAQTWIDAGWDFYALDLRRYGRSLQPDEETAGLQNYVSDIRVYRQELDIAIGHVTLAGHDDIVLLGHSTGGLLASLWANAHPGALSGLMLNSPWLDLNENWLLRHPGTPALRLLSKIAPMATVGHLAPHYGKAIHGDTGGEWSFDLAWKPHDGFPVRAAWISSIRQGHRDVARGLNITCPVLLCCSAASGSAKLLHDALTTTDSVLRVEDMVRLADRLGPDVTLRQYDGGAHDLALSPEPARTRYLTDATNWADDLQ